MEQNKVENFSSVKKVINFNEISVENKSDEIVNKNKEIF